MRRSSPVRLATLGHGQAIRWHASAESVRPMRRGGAGVIGMRFGEGDSALTVLTLRPGCDVLTVTSGGYAKRTPADQYPVQPRGGRGVLTARIIESQGELCAACTVMPYEDVLVTTAGGLVLRVPAAEIKVSGRQTRGARLVRLREDDQVAAVTTVASG